MPVASCKQPGCSGVIEEGYCSVCGHAAAATKAQRPQATQPPVVTAPTAALTPAGNSRSAAFLPSAAFSSSTPSAVHRSTGAHSSRRATNHSTRTSRRQLGAGVIAVPELPSTAPELALMKEIKVPEGKRFCSNCNQPLTREKGFCGKCGQKYSLVATLAPGNLVANQYEVKGAIAYGGLGWIYLAFDKVLSRYVVLKGLLNVQDEASAAVAVAERQFLAALKHPNILGIYNFVQHGAEGYIVMEYVGGQTLKRIRRERGPLPPSEAIAYIHRILGAFSYLHQQGFVYCDFKPDNIMLELNDVKLIDLGAVRRIDDKGGDIYGTVGYSAPEASEGPTVSSDLFTVGRTLAVLVMNIPGFTKERRFTIPGAGEEKAMAQNESLYRFLLRSTAESPSDRFSSADEMADQLLGVLREVAALETNSPRPGASALFGGDMLALSHNGSMAPVKPDFRHLPVPAIDRTDPAVNAVLNASAIPDSGQRTAVLKQISDRFPKSAEAKLRLAQCLISSSASGDAEMILANLEAEQGWDWRVSWYRGLAALAGGAAGKAEPIFNEVYSELPGEIAPQLAFALAEESVREFQRASEMYDRISRTDPSYISAIFGLARCRCALGDRKGAVEALNRIPPSSSSYACAQVEATRALMDRTYSVPGPAELKEVSTLIESMNVDTIDRFRLARQVFETALHLLIEKRVPPAPTVAILGQRFQERKVREGLEQCLRNMAHISSDAEKIPLVDEANRVRPRTWL
ncbi:MAG TPA: tetratricopeptide repeat protein [Bryobacteraceae bacterium]|nr:tetratricopeptide repeat protein [Bryobacteraceae bacterium]